MKNNIHEDENTYPQTGIHCFCILKLDNFIKDLIRFRQKYNKIYILSHIINSDVHVKNMHFCIWNYMLLNDLYKFHYFYK